MMMLIIVNEPNSPHMLLAEPTKEKHSKNLIESIDVVSVKVPPKVKLEERSLQLWSAKAGRIMPTLICEGFGFFIVV